jgi:hypothetical protein
MKILNIAAGKLKPINLPEDYMLVNLDPMYYTFDQVPVIEYSDTLWEGYGVKEFYCAEKANEFMERTRMMFDRICLYRYLEHVSFTDLEYFIYLLSTITEIGATVDVIVPNYLILAEMILNDNTNDPKFAAKNILLTTELLNEPSCPHASIWTPQRATHFFELEKRFKIVTMNQVYKFDGRDIYMRFIAERV